jgi:hypothetical protein
MLIETSAGRPLIMLSVDPAVSTLIGVFFGGAIASGTSFRLESLRARRDEQAAEVRDERDARRAARLLAEELRYGRRLLATASEKDSYTWEPPRTIPTSVWTEYRADFALIASEYQWAAVAAAFRDFDGLNWHMAAVIEEDQWTGAGPQHPMEPRRLGPRSRELVHDALDRIDAAQALLGELLAKGP